MSTGNEVIDTRLEKSRPVSLSPALGVDDEKADLSGSAGVGIRRWADGRGTRHCASGIEGDEESMLAWLQKGSTPIPRDLIRAERIEHLLGEDAGVGGAPSSHLHARDIVDIGRPGEAHGIGG